MCSESPPTPAAQTSTSRRVEALDGGVELRGVADVVAVREVEDVDVGAAGTEALDRRRADAARAARDQRDASFEVVVVAHGGISIRFCHGLRSERDYPLGTKRRDLVRTPGGLALDELDLHGERVSTRRSCARRRRRCACRRRSRGRPGRAQLADNLLRAAELAPVPDETMLEIYTALRPRRSTAASSRRGRRLDEWRRAAAPPPSSARRAHVYAERGLLAPEERSARFVARETSASCAARC